MMSPRLNRTLAFALLILPVIAALGAEDSKMNLLRRQAASRQRTIIFNNDGNEPVYFLKNPTAEELLQSRTSALVGSQVDTIFYCTWSSGLGLFTHATKVGQVFNTREGPFAPNLTQALLDSGNDPLKVMVEFGKKHNKEIFWSLRMNDVHDSNTESDWGPIMFRANRFKAENPDVLFGTPYNPPKIGGWSGVDYGQTKVREYAFRLIKEVCENYDVDGIELDFNRFPVLFKSNAMGRAASEADRAAMTDLLRRVRDIADAVGQKRDRPMLIAVRVPDSVEYSRAIGLDLEQWLAGDLLDMMIVGGYFQLNPWEYSVNLGHKYGVKVYSSTDEARIRLLPEARRLRNSLLSKRGQALNMWVAGVDGIYMFNVFDPHDPSWRELGNKQLLAKLDKDYFASVRGAGYAAVSWFPNAPFQEISSLNPDAPLQLRPGKPISTSFFVGDDFSNASTNPKVTLRLQFKGLPENLTTEQVRVTLNGKLLDNPRLTGGWLDLEKWIEFDLEPKLVAHGDNVAAVALSPTGPPDSIWCDLHLTVRFPKN